MEKRKKIFMSFEVTSDLKERIGEKAKKANVSKSEYIRNALFEYMNK